MVGKMWDVTDKDIDKLSKECMRRCFEDQNQDQDIGQGSNSVNGKGQEILPKGLDSGKTAGEIVRNEASGGSGSGSGMIVTEALVQSRGICKMKYAVGCAPVVYGLLSTHL